MEKNKNRRTFEFYKKNGKREEEKEQAELCEKTRCCVWAEQYYGSCLFSSLSGA